MANTHGCCVSCAVLCAGCCVSKHVSHGNPLFVVSDPVVSATEYPSEYYICFKEAKMQMYLNVFVSITSVIVYQIYCILNCLLFLIPNRDLAVSVSHPPTLEPTSVFMACLIHPMHRWNHIYVSVYLILNKVRLHFAHSLCD